MKSPGDTVDNYAMYAGIAVVYGFVGMVPGVLLGIPAATRWHTKSPIDECLARRFAVSWPAVITGAVMGVVMPFLAALIPVLMGTRVSIREAITDPELVPLRLRTRSAPDPRLPLPAASGRRSPTPNRRKAA
jgi:hypothetical protein